MKLTKQFNKIQKQLRERLIIRSVLKGFTCFAILLSFIIIFEKYIQPMKEFMAVYSIGTAFIISILFFLYHFILKALPQPSVASLAKKVETKHPWFKDSLICAVEKEGVLEKDRNLFESLLIRKATENIREINIEEIIIPKKHGWKNILTTATAIFILLAIGMNSISMKKAMNYLFEESGITVNPADTIHPSRSDMIINAKINRWENDAKISILNQNGITTFPMNSKKNSNELTFTMYDLSKDVKYKISTTSLETKWFNIKVYNPPKIESMDFVLTPPKYTGLKPKFLSELKNTSALIGSEISFKIKTETDSQTPSSNKNSAYLSINKKKTPMKQIDKKIFQKDFILDKKTDLQLIVINGTDRKFESKKITIETIEDMPPVISLISPKKDTQLLPNSKAELTTIASDDFGIKELFLTYSISGRDSVTIKVEIKEITDGKNITETKNITLLDSQKIGAKVGDIISYYFTVSDIKEPTSQTSRTEVAFIEIRKEIKPKKMKGKGKKEKIDVNSLIAELKRIIRLSYDAKHSSYKTQKKIISDLKPAFHDFVTETNKIADKLKSMGLAPKLIDLFGVIVNLINNAEKQIDILDFKKGISREEQALSKLTLIAQALMDNIESESNSKEKSEGKGKGKKGKKGESDEKKKQKDLAITLEKLAQLQQEVAMLADQQGGQNSNLRQIKNNELTNKENENLRDSQNEIVKDADKIIDKIPSFLEKITTSLKEAKHKMETSKNALNASNSTKALRAGIDAQNRLLAAANQLKELKEKLISDAIQKLAESAKQVADAEKGLAGKSKSMSSSKPSKESAKIAKDMQEQVRSASESLKEYTKRVAKDLEKIYPKAAKQLNKAINNLEKEQVQSNMKRAENALFYKRFAKAAKLQNKVSNAFNKLTNDLAKAKGMLPKMSQEKMQEALRKIQKALSQTKGMKGGSGKGKSAKNLKKILKSTDKLLSKLSKDLNSQQMQQLGMGLALAGMNSDSELGINITENILKQAEDLLKEYIVRDSIKKMMNLKKKMSSPPEKYKNQIEEYFKSLSE